MIEAIDRDAYVRAAMHESARQAEGRYLGALRGGFVLDGWFYTAHGEVRIRASIDVVSDLRLVPAADAGLDA